MSVIPDRTFLRVHVSSKPCSGTIESKSRGKRKPESTNHNAEAIKQKIMDNIKKYPDYMQLGILESATFDATEFIIIRHNGRIFIQLTTNGGTRDPRKADGILSPAVLPFFDDGDTNLFKESTIQEVEEAIEKILALNPKGKSSNFMISLKAPERKSIAKYGASYE